MSLPNGNYRPQPRAGRASIVISAQRARPRQEQVLNLKLPVPPPAPRKPERRGLITLPKEDGLVFDQPDGRSTAVFARHDAVELFTGSKHVIGVSIAPQVAFRLSLFLVRYWIWNCWFGLREKLWRWLDARRKARAGHLARR